MEVKFIDNSEKVQQEFNTRIGVALNLIGSQAHSHLVDDTPVRTGNLRNHADWEVSPDEDYVVVGYLKDDDAEKDPYYAKFVEFGSRNNKPQHMLQKAATNHNDEYKAIVKKALRGT